MITNNVYSPPDEEVNTKKVEKSKNWLESNDSPWPIVCKHWRVTFSFRNKDLKSLEDKNLLNIFNTWSHYTNPLGANLIKIDFDYLNLTKCEVNYKVWENFIKEVREYTTVNSNDSRVSQYIEIIDNKDSSSDNNSFYIKNFEIIFRK